MYRSIQSTSISRTNLTNIGDPLNPFLVHLPIYIWTVTPGLLTNVTVTLYWNDGVSNKTETFPLTLLLNGYALFFPTILSAPLTDVDISATLIGTGTYGLAVGLNFNEV